MGVFNQIDRVLSTIFVDNTMVPMLVYHTVKSVDLTASLEWRHPQRPIFSLHLAGVTLKHQAKELVPEALPILSVLVGERVAVVCIVGKVDALPVEAVP